MLGQIADAGLQMICPYRLVNVKVYTEIDDFVLDRLDYVHNADCFCKAVPLDAIGVKSHDQPVFNV